MYEIKTNVNLRGSKNAGTRSRSNNSQKIRGLCAQGSWEQGSTKFQYGHNTTGIRILHLIIVKATNMASSYVHIFNKEISSKNQQKSKMRGEIDELQFMCRQTKVKCPAMRDNIEGQYK